LLVGSDFAAGAAVAALDAERRGWRKALAVTASVSTENAAKKARD
jgi:hypothetical protein